MSGSGADWTRREVLATGGRVAVGVAAGGYAAAAGPARAEAIHTSDAGLVSGPVEIPTKDGTMPAYRAQPAGNGPFPVVLVVHEIFGVHEYIRDVCRRLARAGKLALAPDLYRRQGDASAYTEIPALIREVVAKVPDAQVMADLDAALAWARSHGGNPEKASIVGFCWGGRVVWLYASHRPDLTAGAAWYGRLVGDPRPSTPRHPVDLADAKLAPVLGLYGGEDRGIPLETVFSMRKKLAEADHKSEIVIFPEAPHGFHADYRDSYRKAAAEQGWQRMLDWFARFEEPEGFGE